VDLQPDARHLASDDEAGTSPGDRKFRPDVEGLRAVAVVLVVLFHAGIPGLGGGYVGVDVFFVISGFVITGVLLRERDADHRTSLLSFYGRRCRRIIPAATLVIIVTVVASYAVLGVVGGDRSAVDGRWAAVFLANFHFASIGTNYLTAHQAPSPLQNFWTLAVEEQFYLVYPTLVLVVAWVPLRLAFRTRLAFGLIVVTVASFWLSVAQTATNPTVAYFSPFTRAWELGLGALVAVATPWLLRTSHRIGTVTTWAGLAAILVAAFAFNVDTPYPGWHVAIPVVGAGLVIAGGTAVPPRGAEVLLRTVPFRHLGRLSYSLYLWHWPILVLAAEGANKATLPVSQALAWLLVALVAAFVSYHLVENPIRHLAFARRHPWSSIGIGVGLIALTLSFLTVQLREHAPSDYTTSAPVRVDGTASIDQVEQLVASALRIREAPTNITPASWGGPPGASGCWPTVGQTSVPSCIFGDPLGSHTMVLYGDSHTAMWFQALDDIARKAHWRFMLLGHGSCPAEMVPILSPPGLGSSGSEYHACDQWHTFAIHRINSTKPNLVLITQAVVAGPHFVATSPEKWKSGFEAVFRALAPSHARIEVLGNVPLLNESGPDCLSQHQTDVQACWTNMPDSAAPYRSAERMAAVAYGARYINLLPFFCHDNVCPVVVGRYDVYLDREHVAAPYAEFLEGALSQLLHLPSEVDTPQTSPSSSSQVTRST
jgi:peptidoglycan/LPS O-acetylase OafA/YrhL